MIRLFAVACLLLIIPVLGGCASPEAQMALGATKKVIDGKFTDKVIKRLEDFNDTALEDIAKAEAWLRHKAERLAKAKCRMPATALIRYARAGEENRHAVERDCGIKVDPVAAVVPVQSSVRPPGAAVVIMPAPGGG